MCVRGVLNHLKILSRNKKIKKSISAMPLAVRLLCPWREEAPDPMGKRREDSASLLPCYSLDLRLTGSLYPCLQ